MKKLSKNKILHWVLGIVISIMLATNVYSAPNYIRQDLKDAYYCDWLGNTFPALETNGPGAEFNNKRHVNGRQYPAAEPRNPLLAEPFQRLSSLAKQSPQVPRVLAVKS